MILFEGCNGLKVLGSVVVWGDIAKSDELKRMLGVELFKEKVWNNLEHVLRTSIDIE